MEAGTATAQQRRQVRALGEATVCGAFQATAHDSPDRVAVRTKGDEFSITWSEYAGRVRAAAGGLAGLGLGPGDTVAIMLSNRPEFHVVDAAAMHLGATPFSVYNTLAADQVAHLFSNAENRVVICEAAFAERVA